MEFISNFLEVSGPEAGGGSVADKEKATVLCPSALGDFCSAWYCTVSSFRAAMGLESDSIFASVSLWGVITAVGMAVSQQLPQSQWISLGGLGVEGILDLV